MRHPLARALASAGLRPLDVASRLGVDPKTVDRWFSGRVPYPRHRAELCRMTGWSVVDLWPDTVPRDAEPGDDEVRTTYAHRSLVQPDTWRQLFAGARVAIDIVAYSALFLFEDAVILRTLKERASAGVPVRIALGDLDSACVARRGADEQIGDVMTSRIRNALVLIRPLRQHRNVEVRLHDTVLYDSIYRADAELFVNIHVFGIPAAHAPVVHLRHKSHDGMAMNYLLAVRRIWDSASPLS